jgi:hypothetical protein
MSKKKAVTTFFMLFIIMCSTSLSWAQSGFIEQTINDYTRGATSVIACDFDHDGDQDILVAAQQHHQIIWFQQNQSIEDSTIEWNKKTIASSVYSAHSVAVADFDKDGDNDIIGAQYYGSAGIWIWENLFDSTGVFEFVKDTVTVNLVNVHEVTLADIDGDSCVDILAASSDMSKLCWYKNSGTNPVTWTEFTLDTDVDNAKAIVGSDVDNDGDMDILATAILDHSIYCYRNDSITTDGTVFWTKDTVDQYFNGAHSVRMHDIDGDSLPDMLATAYLGHKVAWWRNAGVDEKGFVIWEKQVIESNFGNACFAMAQDLDNDGLVDVAATAQRDDIVAWWKHSIENGEHTWQYNEITNSFDRPWPLYLNDINNDSLVDIVVGSSYDGNNMVVWYENNLDDTTTFIGNIFSVDYKFDVRVSPNPSKDFINISFELKYSGKVNVEVFDLAGNLIDQIYSGIGESGLNQFRWNFREKNHIAPGIYICSVSSQKGSQAVRFVIE